MKFFARLIIYNLANHSTLLVRMYFESKYKSIVERSSDIYSIFNLNEFNIKERNEFKILLLVLNSSFNLLECKYIEKLSFIYFKLFTIAWTLSHVSCSLVISQMTWLCIFMVALVTLFIVFKYINQYKKKITNRINYTKGRSPVWVLLW